ncbi:hypothetical protein KVA01_24180 [Kocuria varians]|uniref:Uncharacterized protein n=2 Tax=Kocuria varians TaxID=1272 RepID=A0A4Y4D9G5_KOCVA|nr:hypothetical protein KVA01_24180 [Kocuria varians]
MVDTSGMAHTPPTIRNKTALYAVSAAWIAVLLAVALSAVLGKPLVLLLVFMGIVALSVTGFWAIRLSKEEREANSGVARDPHGTDDHGDL